VRASKPSRDEAERIALEALGYLVADEDRLWAFLARRGSSRAPFVRRHGLPGFLVAVLDHVAASEGLLIELAATLAIKPERLMEARHTLAPEPFE
jgi:hypothetical protein